MIFPKNTFSVTLKHEKSVFEIYYSDVTSFKKYFKTIVIEKLLFTCMIDIFKDKNDKLTNVKKGEK